MFKTMKVMVIVIAAVMAMQMTTFAAENTESETKKAWYEVITETVVSGLDTAKTAVCDTATSIGEGCVLAGHGIAKGACSVGNLVKSETGLLMAKAGSWMVITGVSLHVDAVEYFEETEE